MLSEILERGDQNVIDSRIEYWVEKYSWTKAIFHEIKPFKQLIELSRIFLEGNKVDPIFCEDFVDGIYFIFCSFRFKDEECGKLGEELTKPFINQLVSYLNSDQYQKAVISSVVKGNEMVPIGISDIRITAADFFSFTKKEGKLLLIGEDVIKVKVDYINHKLKSYGFDLDGKSPLSPIEQFLHLDVFFPKGYQVFQKVLSELDFSKRGVLADISYFYHELYDKKLIHCSPQKFMNWYNDRYLEYPALNRIHKKERQTMSKDGGVNVNHGKRSAILQGALDQIISK